MPRVTISIKDKQAQPYRFPLDRETVTLGRGSENDISIQSGSVSVHHAKMTRVPGGYELRDLGSTNGLKLDHEKVESIRLKSGMCVRIGDAEFFFQLSDEEQDELRKETPTERGDADEEHPKRGKDRDDDDDDKEDEDDDDDDDEEDEKPKKKSKKKKKHSKDDSHESEDSNRRAPAPLPRHVSTSGGGGGAFVFFLILAVIAFCAGMAIRYQKETGQSLIEAVLSGGKEKDSPVKEVPAEAPPPVE